MGCRQALGLRMLMLLVGVLMGCFCCLGRDIADADSSVYIVTLKQAPTSRYNGELRVKQTRHIKRNGSDRMATLDNPSNISRTSRSHGSYIDNIHDSLLETTLSGEKYLKLYSYRYLINGFAVFATAQQVEKLWRRSEVSNVVLDFPVETATTHTPQFLGLPEGAWAQEGGYGSAGEGIVIGFVDTGIDPSHPSFSDNTPAKPYPVPEHFSGICEVTPDFPSGSCNRKLVGARHFAASAITRGVFNASKDFASPYDVDGHGTHTAAVAAGNHGVPVVVAGHLFGNASGMAPHAHIAVYKALFKSFGGFAADVVASIDQAAQDGVDVISLSITPNRRPLGVATFFNPIDMALLSAVKAGIFVVQAAGNTGPAPRSISSFSPWIFTVGAASHDRIYSNSIMLGNNITITGVGLAPGTDKMHRLVSAIHALNNTAAMKDTNANECQDARTYNQDVVRGNLLICSYTLRYVIGVSTIKQALQTAENLSASGVVFCMDSYVIGSQLNPIPMRIPGIVITSQEDSKVLLQYYNSSLVIDQTTNKIVKFGGTALISGGIKANFSRAAPRIMYYSARGPDPEDGFLTADILKPNIVAPGNFIWSAWSSHGTDSVEFLGEDFAMMSGTSMAAPHIAGLAALIKQRFPSFTPAAIGSALSTTASINDRDGGPIMAQRSFANPDLNQSPATFFDMGSGFVNATAALDPGLVLDSSYEDYMAFLCSINGSSPLVLNYTGESCGASTLNGIDLNLPSITLSKLNQSAIVQRTVTNIGCNETYSVSWSAPAGALVKVTPTRFSIASGQKQVLSVFLNASSNSSVASFGRIRLSGTQGHFINIPLSVIAVSYRKTGG
ncbi:subtilisin-like protease SBT2.2 [Andrographis paniculata]|uniref:subtilisin-like protease SBT2.2 n=1 Tax=Andrographis paniculata TaxID=175694 RepID=UPI0021E94779|nr:subtilisin-like protease SBT2.2 [Andrographis paniculata]